MITIPAPPWPSAVHLGLTASRDEITGPQREVLAAWLAVRYRRGAATLHHGDCVGGDETGARLADEIGYTTVAHPPDVATLRAFHPSTVIREPRPYLTRNADIVSDVEEMMALPKRMNGQGGTWWTIRHARTHGCPLLIVAPDGTITESAFQRAGRSS